MGCSVEPVKVKFLDYYQRARVIYPCCPEELSCGVPVHYVAENLSTIPEWMLKLVPEPLSRWPLGPWSNSDSLDVSLEFLP